MTTEYEVSSVDNNQAQVNAHMREMAELGWDLVSGSAITFPVTKKEAVRIDVNEWQTRFVMYWKRP